MSLLLMGAGTPGLAVPFTPAAPSGLVAWFQADVGTKQTVGGIAATADDAPVGQWLDQSGNGNHLTQATAGQRPLLKLAIQNGLPAIRFDGIDDVLALPDVLSALTAGSHYMVVSQRIADTTGWKIGSHADNSFLNFAGDVYDQFGSTTRHSTTGGTAAPALNGWNIYSAFSAAGAWSAALDGAVIITDVVNTVGFTTAPTYGAGHSAVGGYDFGEILIYSRVLTGPEDTNVRAYLAARWATP